MQQIIFWEGTIAQQKCQNEDTVRSSGNQKKLRDDMNSKDIEKMREMKTKEKQNDERNS